MEEKIYCKNCNGTGRVPCCKCNAPKRCKDCNGNGKTLKKTEDENDPRIRAIQNILDKSKELSCAGKELAKAKSNLEIAAQTANVANSEVLKDAKNIMCSETEEELEQSIKSFGSLLSKYENINSNFWYWREVVPKYERALEQKINDFHASILHANTIINKKEENKS